MVLEAIALHWYLLLDIFRLKESTHSLEDCLDCSSFSGVWAVFHLNYEFWILCAFIERNKTTFSLKCHLQLLASHSGCALCEIQSHIRDSEYRLELSFLKSFSWVKGLEIWKITKRNIFFCVSLALVLLKDKGKSFLTGLLAVSRPDYH